MFESAEVYASTARDFVAEARTMLAQYGQDIQGGDGETALDIGCGSGNVTVEAIGKFRNWKQIIGVDCNKLMVDYANQHLPDPQQFSYQLLNFNEPLDPNFAVKKFDKIFSFLALHWMNNRRTVAQNIYDLLNPGGQVFLVIVAHSKIYEVWDDIAKSSKWKPYITVNGPLNDLVYSDNPGEMFLQPLKEAGLSIIKSVEIERKNVFSALENTDESKVEKLKAVDPFLRNIPEDMQREYLQDLLKRVLHHIGPNGATDYTALVILGEKKK